MKDEKKLSHEGNPTATPIVEEGQKLLDRLYQKNRARQQHAISEGMKDGSYHAPIGSERSS